MRISIVILISIFLLTSFVLAETQESPKSPDELVVDNFDKGRTMGIFSERITTLGTYHGTWAKRPSWTVITKSATEKRGKEGLGLVIEFSKEAGWCGWYTLLDGADVTGYNALSFWVKGSEGGEKFDIGFADRKMQDLEIDAVYAGPIVAFLPKGITTEWQEAKIPLARVGSEINLSSMGSIVFWFAYRGRGKIYVDDVRFVNDPEISKIIEYNLPCALSAPGVPRSLWVWKIDPINNLRQRDELLKFSERTCTTTLYLYFGPVLTEANKEYTSKLAEFLRQCHSKGIKVEALTGYPTWALEEYHQTALDWIKGFLEFNKTRPAEERINGVSLDVEPYLTQEWTSQKEAIKKDYLEFLKKCRKLIDGYKEKFEFVFGVAIPLFYDGEDDGEFERKIFEYVDYVALMDYYDTAEDVIEQARFHIDLANKMGKGVVIGVETQNLVEMQQGKPRNTFYEEGWEEMERVLGRTAEAYKGEPSFSGLAVHSYYSYKVLTRGRNVPMKERPKDIYTIFSYNRGGKKVVIDGDLSDWVKISPHLIEYKDNVVYGREAWFGPKDLSVKFYSMWDKDSLYFAFDVADEKLIQEKTGPDMWEGDHVEFWIDADLLGDYNEAVNSSDDFQFGLSPGNFDNVKPEVFIWTPSVKDELKDKIQIGAKKTENGYIVEVEIPSEVIFYEEFARVGVEPKGIDINKIHYIYKLEGEPTLRLHKGFRLGISVDPSDSDNKRVPQESLMSSSVNRIWGDPTTFGILELK